MYLLILGDDLLVLQPEQRVPRVRLAPQAAPELRRLNLEKTVPEPLRTTDEEAHDGNAVRWRRLEVIPEPPEKCSPAGAGWALRGQFGSHGAELSFEPGEESEVLTPGRQLNPCGNRMPPVRDRVFERKAAHAI